MTGILHTAQQYVNGAETLASWVGHGAVPVSQELAQSRTDTCNRCELNKPGIPLVESIASAIKTQVELRNRLGLRTNGIKSLKSCSACNCYLPLKIFIPLDRVLKSMDEEEMSRLWDQCWIKLETK